MKNLKFGLRALITVASIVSFTAGWIMLVRAPKPAPLIRDAVNTTLPTLEPLTAFRSDDGFQSQQFFSVQPQRRFGSNSFFRTGGS